MKIESFTTAEVFEKLRAEWSELLTHVSHNRIFLTWEWQSTWWSAYHPGDLWVLAVRNDAGQLVGLAPWFIEQRAKTGRTVRSVGCVDVTDYLETIVHQDYESLVFEMLATYVDEHQSCYDFIDLCNIPEGSPVLKFFPQLLQERGLSVEIKPQEVCPVIELPSTWDAYLETLDKKQRHEIRRKLRRSEESPVAWYAVGPEHDLAAETDIFLRLMARASEDKTQFLENPQNVAFFKQVTPLLMARGWLQIAFLTVEGRHAAAYMNFLYSNEVQIYNSGLDIEAAQGLSAGIVLLSYLIQFAIEHGYKRFDFLRGNEEYKYRMGAVDTHVFMLMASYASHVISVEPTAVPN
ncbi:MAG: GNAT family N-acetyltransferase [Chloroflexi bacterium]|nr:GNAT family N-acetyltransferase [Chloroflexota bacterium]